MRDLNFKIGYLVVRGDEVSHKKREFWHQRLPRFQRA